MGLSLPVIELPYAEHQEASLVGELPVSCQERGGCFQKDCGYYSAFVTGQRLDTWGKREGILKLEL